MFRGEVSTPQTFDYHLAFLSLQDENAFEALERLQSVIDSYRNPTGEKEYPARTCKDLALAHPDFNDGLYWIDPNQGSPVDAIEVWCNIKGHQTCILPKPSEVPRGEWYKGPQQHVWFGEEMDEGFQVRVCLDEMRASWSESS